MSSLLDIPDLNDFPPEFKKEGSDWFAVFNPNAERVLDITPVHTLEHESVVCCVRFSPDGKYLATGCNRKAHIYNTETGELTYVLAIPNNSEGKPSDLYVRSVCFSPDGRYLVTAAEDKLIRIWDIARMRIRNVFYDHKKEIYSLDYSPDGRIFVSGSADETARIWDTTDGNSKVLAFDRDGDDCGVTSVAISPNCQLVAAANLATLIRIWDASTGALLEQLQGHSDSVYSIAFTPDGKGLVSASLDKTLKYWDVSALTAEGGPESSGEKCKCTMDFIGHKDYVLTVAVSHEGNWIVSGSKDRSMQFWDPKTGVVQCMIMGHKNSVISVDTSPTGNFLASGSGDRSARIWKYTTI